MRVPPIGAGNVYRICQSSRSFQRVGDWDYQGLRYLIWCFNQGFNQWIRIFQNKKEFCFHVFLDHLWFFNFLNFMHEKNLLKSFLELASWWGILHAWSISENYGAWNYCCATIAWHGVFFDRKIILIDIEFRNSEGGKSEMAQILEKSWLLVSACPFFRSFLISK